MTLLIVGDAEDLTSAYLRHRAEARGAETLILDESRFGSDWEIEFSDPPAGAAAAVPDALRLAGGDALPLARVTGAYVRFDPRPTVPDAFSDDPALAETYARERRAAIHAFLHHLAAPVANRPGHGQANGSKPLQMAELARAGFDVPAWIASNDRAALARFAAAQPDGAVVKSCSGTRSQVRLWSADFAERLAQGSPPVVAQSRVEGADMRLHMVGARAFATRIDAGTSIDYRFAADEARYRADVAPAAIVARCAAFAERAGLVIAGFDFRVAPDGRWWCLECNPAPTFLPYELETGQPIAAALLSLIGVGDPSAPRS